MKKIFILKNDIYKARFAYNIDLASLYDQAGVPSTLVPEDYFSDILMNDQTRVTDYNLAAIKSSYVTPFEFPELYFLSKKSTKDNLNSLNLPFFDEKPINSLDDIVNFPHSRVIVKPFIGSAAKSIYDFVYVILDKQELISRVEASGVDISSLNLVIQEAANNNGRVIWVGGYVSRSNDIVIEGILNQVYIENPNYKASPERYSSGYKTYITSETKSNFSPVQQAAIDQITRIIKIKEIISTPFCIQGIEADDGTFKLIDFNFGWGKGYAMSVHRNNPQYFIDRIRFMFFNEPFEKDNLYRVLCSFDFPDGITPDIKTFFNDVGAVFGGAVVPHDLSYYEGGPVLVHHYSAPICTTGSTHEEAMHKLNLISNFLNQPIPDIFI